MSPAITLSPFPQCIFTLTEEILGSVKAATRCTCGSKVVLCVALRLWCAQRANDDSPTMVKGPRISVGGAILSNAGMNQSPNTRHNIGNTGRFPKFIEGLGNKI